jgi:hypothetical protein
MDPPLDHEQVTQRELQIEIAGLDFDITTRAHAHPDPTQSANWLQWQHLYTVSSPANPFRSSLVAPLLPVLIFLVLTRSTRCMTPCKYLFHLSYKFSKLRVVLDPPLPPHWTHYGVPHEIFSRSPSPVYHHQHDFGSPNQGHDFSEANPLPLPLVFGEDMLPDALPPLPHSPQNRVLRCVRLWATK